MQRSSPVYTSGTITGTIGDNKIYGVGTSWQVTDAQGNVTYNVATYDELLISGQRTVLITSVDSPTQITLSEPLPFGINAGSAYAIIQRTPLPTNAIAGLVQALASRGSDATPISYQTLDNGVSRLRLGFDNEGRIQIQVRPSSGTDAGYHVAILIDPATGNCTVTGLTSSGSGPFIANTIRATVGAPANTIGIPGDFAIDPLAQVMYGPKGTAVWPAGISFKGADADLTALNSAVEAAMADPNNAPFTDFVVLTPDDSAAHNVPVGRTVEVDCTSVGTVSLKLANGKAKIETVRLGHQTFAWAVVGLNATGTTAACVVTNCY